MAAIMLDDRQILNKKYPFLVNYPFPDFKLEIGEVANGPIRATDDEPKASKYDSPIIRFLFESDSKISINIHENDLNWICQRAEHVTELDTIAKKIELGLVSNNILLKRNAVEDSDLWIKLLSDEKTMLAYSTFTEALTGLIGKRSLVDATRLINNINKLAAKKGLVRLGKDEYSVILTYYQFRLVYTKLILGLVIAAKISL